MKRWVRRSPKRVCGAWAPRLSATLLATILLAGCGSSDDRQQQLDSVASWTATMQLAVAEHQSHAITTAYVTQLTDAAGQALVEARQSLARATHPGSDDRQVTTALDSLARAIRDLEAESRQ